MKEQKPAKPVPTQYLEGTLERLTFQNEENGYTVAKLIPKGKSYEVTVVGTLSGVNVGELLHLEGRWINHPQYGRQFEVQSYSVHYPATVEGLRKYLGSGLVYGVGPVTASRIVDHFGLEILDIIETHPERLREVTASARSAQRPSPAPGKTRNRSKRSCSFSRGTGSAPV